MYGADMNHPRTSTTPSNSAAVGVGLRLSATVMGLLLSLCLVPATLAQSPAQVGQAPVEIEADQAEFEQQSGISRYRGNVRVIREQAVIEGDELVITPSEDGDHLHFSMRGTPATYEESLPQQPPMSARAEHMQYIEVDDILLLEGAARVSRGRDVLHGEQIRYERGAGRIRATGGESPDGRVRILINPDEGN